MSIDICIEDRKREKLKAYYSENKEKLRAYKRERYAKNPRRILDRNKRWALENPDWVKKYREENRELISIKAKAKRCGMDWKELLGHNGD